MSEPQHEDHRRIETEMEEEIAAKEARKLKARAEKNRSIWFGLGMFGMIGWSVAVPTLIGVAVGCWLDATFPSRISWCLTGLFVGVVIGASIAWNWIKQEGHLE